MKQGMLKRLLGVAVCLLGLGASAWALVQMRFISGKGWGDPLVSLFGTGEPF